ncbi:hypothetical protein ES703_02620 [subsurface metagenome]
MSDPVQDIIQAFRILFKASNSTTYSNTVLSKLRSIFISEATARVFTYFCLHGTATTWMLQVELNMPESTVYRVIRRLRSLGVIVPALKLSKIKQSRGGPRPTVWAIENATPNEVHEARRTHYRMLSLKEEGKGEVD